MSRSESPRELFTCASDDGVPSPRSALPAGGGDAPADRESQPNDDFRLHQARKLEALGQLTGTIVHDFNNLLTIIDGYCAEAMDATSPGSEVRFCLEGIAEATRRASALSGKLLAYSQEKAPVMQRVDLSGFVEGLHDLLDGFVGENITVTLRTAREPCPVLVDHVGLEQVVMNLAANARDAMPVGGTLTVETSRVHPFDPAFVTLPEVPPGDFVTLAVSDTGFGMPSHVLARAFEPFFTTKGEGKGTGLGLSSVQGIVRQHGGYVTCRSAPGKGTRFTVFLPPADCGSGG